MPPFSRWELGRLVHTWAANGEALPVAVVVSIIDDVCEALAAAPPGDDVAISLDHVIIDQAGVARITVRPREAVPAVSSLLREALAAGRGDEAIPAAAWPVLGQGLSDDPWVRTAGTDVMQQQLRDALGPPAARDEVLGCCALMRNVVSSPAPLAEVPSVLPWEARSVLPVDVDLASLTGGAAERDAPVGAVDPREASTEVLGALEVPSMVGPASEVTVAAPLARDGVSRVPFVFDPVEPAVEPEALGSELPLVEAELVEAGSEAMAALLAEGAAPVAVNAEPEVAAAAAPVVVAVNAEPVVVAAAEPEVVAAAEPVVVAAAEPVVREPAPVAPAPVATAPSSPAVLSGPPVIALSSLRPSETPGASGPPRPALAPPALPATARARADRPSVTPDRPSAPPEVTAPTSDRPALISVPPRAPLTAVLPEDLEAPPSLLPKPVLRHEPPRRRPVSLPAAPAARLGPSPSASPDDSGIQLPSESPIQKALIALLAVASAILVAWLLGLV